MRVKIITIGIISMFLLTGFISLSTAINIVKDKDDVNEIETKDGAVVVWGCTYYGLIYNQMTPLSDVEVKAISLDGEILDVSHTDKNGHWVVGNISPRRMFQIRFYHDDYYFRYNDNYNFMFLVSGVYGPYNVYMLEKKAKNVDSHLKILEQYPSALSMIQLLLKLIRN